MAHELKSGDAVLSGGRSALAGAVVQDLDDTSAAHLDGGPNAGAAGGRPVEGGQG